MIFAKLSFQKGIVSSMIGEDKMGSLYRKEKRKCMLYTERSSFVPNIYPCAPNFFEATTLFSISVMSWAHFPLLTKTPIVSCFYSRLFPQCRQSDLITNTPDFVTPCLRQPVFPLHLEWTSTFLSWLLRFWTHRASTHTSALNIKHLHTHLWCSWTTLCSSTWKTLPPSRPLHLHLPRMLLLQLCAWLVPFSDRSSSFLDHSFLNGHPQVLLTFHPHLFSL